MVEQRDYMFCFWKVVQCVNSQVQIELYWGLAERRFLWFLFAHYRLTHEGVCLRRKAVSHPVSWQAKRKARLASHRCAWQSRVTSDPSCERWNEERTVFNRRSARQHKTVSPFLCSVHKIVIVHQCSESYKTILPHFARYPAYAHTMSKSSKGGNTVPPSSEEGSSRANEVCAYKDVTKRNAWFVWFLRVAHILMDSGYNVACADDLSSYGVIESEKIF